MASTPKTSREGKQIPPSNAPIRKSIKQPLCAKCVHCLDLCRDIYRVKVRGGVFVECNGFQDISEHLAEARNG